MWCWWNLTKILLVWYWHNDCLRVWRSLNRNKNCHAVWEVRILIFNNEDVRESPFEGAFERNFACEIEATKGPSSNVAFLSRRIQCKLAQTMVFANSHWIRRDRNATFELSLSRLNTFQKITRNLPKIPDYTRRAHVLRDVKHSLNVHVNARGENLTFILKKVLFCYFYFFH